MYGREPGCYRGCLSTTVLLLGFETPKENLWALEEYIRAISPRKTLAFFTQIASRLVVSLSHLVIFTLIYPYDEALFVNQHPRRNDLRHRSDDANFQHASFLVSGFYQYDVIYQKIPISLGCAVTNQAMKLSARWKQTSPRTRSNLTLIHKQLPST